MNKPPQTNIKYRYSTAMRWQYRNCSVNYRVFCTIEFKYS